MKSKFSRRGFLAAAAAVAGFSAFRLHASPQKHEKLDEERWVNAACWHNCGGRCVNKVLIASGVIVRQKTDDTHADSTVYPQQRACVKGRSLRRYVLSLDRLKYPMKRAHWKPGGGDRTLRGRDEWVRISWDEALDLVAAEMKRVKAEAGCRSIFLNSWTEYNEYHRVMALFGGYTGGWGTCSYGNWTLTPQTVGLGNSGGHRSANDRLDFLNCGTVVMFGCNTVWSASGMTPHTLITARKNGTRFIGIDPFYNETYAVLEADWIPVRPGTDTALLLAVAHTLITEDRPESNPLIDWEFLNKASVGFDAASMPEGAKPEDNFKDYVLGVSDGTAKDAVWAEAICGVPAGRIKRLAAEIGMKNSVALLASWGVCRVNNSDNFPQLLMTVGAMTGHMGKPGHMTGSCSHITAGNHGYRLVTPGSDGLDWVENPVNDYINDSQTWDAILGRPYNYTGYGSHGVEWKPCQTRTADIRMIFHGSGNRLESLPHMRKGIEAHRSVEFVVSAATVMSMGARYSDIILPVNTYWERYGGLTWSNRETVIVYSQVMDSMYESMDDQWIVSELAKRLGINVKDIYPHDRKQQFFNMVAGAKVISEKGPAGGYEPLCTITHDDIQAWGVQGTPQQGRIAIEELMRRGVYQVERYAGDPYSYIAYENFRKDPSKYPLATQTGKLEIYSRELARKITAMNYSTVPPIPKYIPPLEGYEQSFQDWPRGVKGAYPYQLITVRYIKRVHNVMDNVDWLSEAFSSPVYINSADAEKEGIKDGDEIMISSRFGSSLRTAVPTGRIMPGCMLMLHGSSTDYDEEAAISRGGGDNILFGDVVTGQGTTGYNSLLVKVSRRQP